MNDAEDRPGSIAVEATNRRAQAEFPGGVFVSGLKTTNWPEHKIGHIAPLIRGGFQTEPFSQHFRENDFPFPCWEVRLECLRLLESPSGK